MPYSSQSFLLSICRVDALRQYAPRKNKTMESCAKLVININVSRPKKPALAENISRFRADFREDRPIMPILTKRGADFHLGEDLSSFIYKYLIK
jgi:hypothetical protein